jgi:hypothetical protein
MTGFNEQGTKGRRLAVILTTIEKRYSTDHHGPCVEEDEGWRRDRGRKGRAKIFK